MRVPGSPGLGLHSYDIIKTRVTVPKTLDEFLEILVQAFIIGHVLRIGQSDPTSFAGIRNVRIYVIP